MFNQLSVRITRRISAALAVLLALTTAAPLAVAATTIVYVKPGTSGSGASWADAANLTPALIAGAATGTEIWVAAGTYTPGTQRSDTFTLKNGVAIYGGFSGNETLLSQRNVAANVTILSGDLLANDTGVIGATNPTRAENSYHVVSSAVVSALLDGMTIRSGNANGASGFDYEGGGMLIVYSSPTLTNMTFSGNSAENGGGGISSRGSSPTLTNVTFSGNSAANGGGMVNGAGGSPILTNVTFSGNSATYGYAGGMGNYYSINAILTNVTFSGNSAYFGGGGMENYQSHPILTNVTFNGNSARYGGAMENSGGANSSNPTLTNVTFSGNSAADSGGGMENNPGSPILKNVMFSGNMASYGGGMNNGSGSNPTLTNVTFSGNSVQNNGGGMYITSSGSTLTNVTFSDNTGQSGGGIWNDNTSAVTLTNTILAKNTAGTGPDCAGTVVSRGYNLLGDPSGCTFGVQIGDLVGSGTSPINPQLGPLKDNGGLTPTRALLPGSPAIDAGDPTTPGSGGNACPATDQRGVSRLLSARCDIGAVEVVPADTTSTTAGTGAPGLQNGPSSAARFSDPLGVAANVDGTLALVADTANHVIRKIDSATGLVTTLAGSGQPGFTDGISSTAQFRYPSGVALSADGRLALVADTDNNAIRKINVASGQVTTITGTDTISPTGVAMDAGGTFALVADYGNHVIRKIDIVSGQVTILAGSPGIAGDTNGTGSAARFNNPTGVALSANGMIVLVADTGNNAIRKIDVPTARVTTLTILAASRAIGPAKSISIILGISISPEGCTGALSNSQTHTITSIDAMSGQISSVVGSGQPGSVDDVGTKAQFSHPSGVILTNGGSTALVADASNNKIRRIDSIPKQLCQRSYLPLR